MSDFSFLAGLACIIFAFTGPLAYCTVQRGKPTSGNDLHLACINAKGEWKSEGGGYTCIFPKTTGN